MFLVKEHAKRDLTWWHSRANSINFSPTYQRRGSLWDMRRKAQLIDSIVNQYDLPKFYLVDFTSLDSSLSEGSYDYAIVDGKQRLEAIFGFLSNEFPLAQNFRYFVRPDIELAGLYYRDIQNEFPDVAATISSYVITVMSIVTNEKERIDDLYIRLNIGISLNGAEVRNAMPGVVPGLYRQMVSHDFFEYKILFKTWRMQDLNVAAKLLLIEFNGGFADTKRSSLDRFTKLGTSMFTEPFFDSHKRAIRVLDKMCVVFKDKDKLLRTEAPVPIYYWLIRNVDEQHLSEVWPFLTIFETGLKLYRKEIEHDPTASSVIFDRYYEKARSSNDVGSMLRRYEILSSEFDHFTRTGSTRLTTYKSGTEAELPLF